MIRLVFACLFFTLPAYALELSGTFEQGGIAFGKTVPGSTVELDKTNVPVAADGRFVLGFGRNAPPEMIVHVSSPDGTSAQRILDIIARDWQVQRIDGLPRNQVSPDPETVKRIRQENGLIAAVREASTDTPHYAEGFIRPITDEARRSGVFGSQRILNGQARSPHSGTDWAAPTGTPVIATADGVVSLLHQDMFLTGKTVMVDHGGGVQSIYIHMDSITVTSGQAIARGQQLGTVGSTGRSTGPHLHFGITWQGVKLDPETVLKALPASL